MGLASARFALTAAVGAALTAGAAQNVKVRPKEPLTEDLKALLASGASFISVVPMSVSDQTRSTASAVWSIPSPIPPVTATIAIGDVTFNGTTPTVDTLLVAITSDGQVLVLSFLGTESLADVANGFVNGLHDLGVPCILNDDGTVTALTVTTVRFITTNGGTLVFEVGREVTTFKVTVYSPIDTTRDALRDMIVSSVGTALQHHLILADGTDALTLRTAETLTYSMENDYAAFVTNIMFTMDYAVTITDLATPVAATEVTLTVDESQPVTFIS